MRSGARTLLLLSSPLNALILRALMDGPTRLADLRRAARSPAQTTLRAQLKKLTESGAIEKHRRNRFPGVLEYELTASGRELLVVVDVLASWLAEAPDGPLALGGNQATVAIRALAEAWSSTMLRALASGPLSLTELDGVIASLSYPSLERRLAAMRITGLVKACPDSGRRTPYAVTAWLRRGIAPLMVAAHWERRHRPRATTPVGQLDVETVLLLAIPMVRPPQGTSGTCRLAAETGADGRRRLSGVVVEIRDDATIKSYTTDLDGRADAWALGSVPAWLAAVIERDAVDIELGGNSPLARSLIDGLHMALFRPRTEPTLT